jgi:hypothetical protein
LKDSTGVPIVFPIEALRKAFLNGTRTSVAKLADTFSRHLDRTIKPD